MADSPKALREQRAETVKEIRRMADLVNDEKRDFSAEEAEKWKRINDDCNALTRRIEIAEQAETVERQSRERSDRSDRVRGGVGDGAEATEEHRALAFQAWCRQQYDMGLTDEHEDACERVGLNPRRRTLDLPLASSRDVNRLAAEFRSRHPSRQSEVRAIGTTHAGSGAAYVPESFVNSLEVNLLAHGGIRQVADQIRTTSGEPMFWPTFDDTSNKGRRLNEAKKTQEATDPATNRIMWYAYKYTSDVLKVDQEFLEDSAFDLSSMLGEMLGERLGRKTNEDYVHGDGNSAPHGIYLTSKVGKTTAGATAILADEILDLIHSIDPAYRAGSRFMMHDNILLYLRKIKLGTGEYLWQPGMTGGVPDKIHGYDLSLNQEMDDAVSSGKRTVIFGRLSNYKIRTVRALRLYRLEELYRENDQDGFVAFVREDGNQLNAGTNPIAYLQQA